MLPHVHDFLCRSFPFRIRFVIDSIIGGVPQCLHVTRYGLVCEQDTGTEADDGGNDVVAGEGNAVEVQGTCHLFIVGVALEKIPREEELT